MTETFDFDAWEAPAKEGRIADAIEQYVRTYDYVTFVELGRRLKPYIEVRGDVALEIAPNVILWAGMSQAFADAITELQQGKRIWPHPSSLLTYFHDGGALRMPIAKRIPKGGYKKEHWLPVTFRVTPP